MKRGVLAAVVLALLTIGICWPALTWGDGAGDNGYEPTRITDYRADFRVDDDGDLRVTERIVVDFGSLGDRHGIFRYWDRHDPNATDQRRTPRDVRILRNGEPEEVEWSAESLRRYDVARIGSAYRTVAGEQTYLISYTIDEVLLDRGERSAFHWNLVPGGWAQSIDRARLTVSLPAQSSAVRCAVGWGEAENCTANGEGGRDLEVEVGPLEPRTPVTLSTEVAMSPPESSPDRQWSMRWDPVLGTNLPAAVVVVVLAALAAVSGHRMERRTHESDPHFPLLYAPPEILGPAQADYLLHEKVSRRDFVATVLHLAERGVVRLERSGEGERERWSLTAIGTPEQWAALDDVSRRTAEVLGLPARSFTASRSVHSGRELKEALKEIDRLAPRWGRDAGLVVRAGIGSSGALLPLAGLGMALIAVLGVWVSGMTLLALVPGAFAATSMGWLLPGSGTVRTTAARDLWSRVGGFRRVLSTPSGQQRFEFSGRRELYTAYLPWAVAFGAADEWARKYRTETGEEPPAPSYLGGVHPYTGTQPVAFVDQMLASFDRTVDSAISSYEASIASSSSGSGSSSGGGGGGGGGGGSW